MLRRTEAQFDRRDECYGLNRDQLSQLDLSRVNGWHASAMLRELLMYWLRGVLSQATWRATKTSGRMWAPTPGSS